MTKPARQRPDVTSDVGRRLQLSVESLMSAQLVVTPPTPAQPAHPPQPAAADVKEPFSTRLPRATLSAAKAAVMATAGQPGGCRSLADLIAQAVDDKVAQLQQQFNDGQPFSDPGTFRTGRPLGG